MKKKEAQILFETLINEHLATVPKITEEPPNGGSFDYLKYFLFLLAGIFGLCTAINYLEVSKSVDIIEVARTTNCTTPEKCELNLLDKTQKKWNITVGKHTTIEHSKEVIDKIITVKITDESSETIFNTINVLQKLLGKYDAVLEIHLADSVEIYIKNSIDNANKWFIPTIKQ